MSDRSRFLIILVCGVVLLSVATCKDPSEDPSDENDGMDGQSEMDVDFNDLAGLVDASVDSADLSVTDVDAEVGTDTAVDSTDQSSFDLNEYIDQELDGFEVDVHTDDVEGSDLRVGVYLARPVVESGSFEVEWIAEIASAPLQRPTTTITVPAAAIEYTATTTWSAGERPLAEYYFIAYSDTNGNERHDAEELDDDGTFEEPLGEVITGMSQRLLLLVYEGALQDMPSWSSISFDMTGGSGPVFHEMDEGFELLDLSLGTLEGFSGTVVSASEPHPDRISTFAKLEAELGGLLRGRPIDIAIGDEGAFSFDLTEPLNAGRLKVEPTFGSIRSGTEFPVSYIDSNGNDQMNEGEMPDAGLCMEVEASHRQLVFSYFDLPTHPLQAQFVVIFGLHLGWNAMLMPEGEGGPTFLPDTNFEGKVLTFDDSICPFMP